MNVIGSRLFGVFVGKHLAPQLPRCFSSAVSNLNDEISNLVKNEKVVVFMKGNPDQPRCGFSNAVVQILRMHGVTYAAHDVLQREDIRNGIKEYSNWPTIPQVFINGEFVGGCDILMQLHQTGNLVNELQKAGIKSALTDAVDTDEKKS